MAGPLRARVLLSALPAVVVVVIGLFAADGALACAVCALAQEEARKAFVGTTWLLSFLPLALIGGVVWWLYDRARAVEREEREAQRQRVEL